MIGYVASNLGASGAGQVLVMNAIAELVAEHVWWGRPYLGDMYAADDVNEAIACRKSTYFYIRLT
ncbi:hypothetical protein CANCADRAFT_87361 [Tortispora caseinolytica NRRL Y-17796]|uniref:Uncharacterized protein n=1 Tax=Tortispora caseinolytica NRRL Y-17796 TaxID=767744 RepID=A0A1E4TL95_9ASCO|nr:hypothetical protein CANCADRAFT_87361 [Tortispora caseinolytica NRRL Y-17796]